jgi:hypothetical protein
VDNSAFVTNILTRKKLALAMGRWLHMRKPEPGKLADDGSDHSSRHLKLYFS